MKIAYKEFNSVINFDETPVFTLVIEAPRLLCQFLHDIKQQLAGNEGDVVLSDKSRECSVKRKLELISDPVDMDINTTSLLGKVASRVDTIALDETHFEEAQQILSRLEKFVYDILLEMEADFYCDKLTMLSLVKACGIRADACQNSLVELLFTYMKLVREFDTDKLFVFVNLHSFVEKSDLQDFFDTIRSHGFQALFLESHDYPRLNGEAKLIIDEDRCEI